MANAQQPSPFISGYRLLDGQAVNTAIATGLRSSQGGITAHSGGGKTSAFQLVSVLNRVSTAAAPNDSVLLPDSQPGLQILIENDGASSIQVFGKGTDTINGIATGTGVAQPAGAYVTYTCTTKGAWHGAAASDGIFTALTATTVNGNVITTGTGTLTLQGTATATGPATSGTLALINPVPVTAGATLAVTAAMSGAPILLNIAAGSVATLPAATGSGNKFKFIVTTTASSNAHKILAASSSDFLNGNAVGHTAAGATLAFSAAAATAHSVQMPFAGTQPSGGFIGDYFEFTDVAANLWAVNGMYQAGTTATTPFSAATS